MATLKAEILDKLVEKTGKAKSTVRKDLSVLRSRFPSCSLNAVAAIYAKTYGISIMRMLTAEEKANIPHVDVVKSVPKITKQIKQPKKIELFLTIETNNIFYNKHICEINKAYNAKCFTSVNILLRKIIENMIIDILRTKYPATSRENKELYYDTTRNVYNDFSKVLENLYTKRTEFGMDKKKIERLHNLCKVFKDDANDKTHSLFFIVETKEEIDNLHAETIFALINDLAKSIAFQLFKKI
jgi:hypothetical protein